MLMAFSGFCSSSWWVLWGFNMGFGKR